ncbi:MAG: QcrA and Rieske domain-containing protein [Dehalococcoidia bacterium]
MAEVRRKARTRREILILVSAGLSGIAATIMAIPVVGALLAPLVRPQPGEWRAVGAVDSFNVGETTQVTFPDSSPLAWAGPAANTAAWLRRVSDQQFQAFAINCTHLGCPLRWLQQANLFMCPCHGGVFYKDGSVAAGPPRQPLSVYPVRIRDSQVEIQTSAIPIV